MDSFTFMLIAVVITAVILAIIKKRSRDACLKDFESAKVTVFQNKGKPLSGRLRVAATGMEITYDKPEIDKAAPLKASQIVYKAEYTAINIMVRYYDDLSPSILERRAFMLKHIGNPLFLQKIGRKFMNIFKTMRDSAMEVINLLLAQAKKSKQVGSTVTSQDKNINTIKDQMVGSVGNAYEPLLEHHIGHRVVVDIKTGETFTSTDGILCEYTADFIELLDVRFVAPGQEDPRKADIILPRTMATVRHLGEELAK